MSKAWSTMDPHKERLVSQLERLVTSATTARLRFSQGAISDSIFFLQETRHLAEELEDHIFAIEQEHVHRDARSGSQSEPIPPGYQRQPAPQGFQEHGRAATFPHPRPLTYHHQPGNLQSFSRGPDSSTLGTRHMTFSEPSPVGGSGPRTPTGYPHPYRGQGPDLYPDPHATSPRMQPSPQRQHPFHPDLADPHGGNDMQMGRKRPSASMTNHPTPVYPPSTGGPERPSGGYPMSHPVIAQEPAPVTPSHRGSTGNMTQPTNSAVPRQRQNSLPHVFENHHYQHQPQPQHQQQQHYQPQHSQQHHQHQNQQQQQQYPSPHSHPGHHQYSTHAQVSPKIKGAAAAAGGGGGGGPTSPSPVQPGVHRSQHLYQGGYESHHQHHPAPTHDQDGSHARLHHHMEEGDSPYSHSASHPVGDERRHPRPPSLQPRRSSQQYPVTPTHGASHQSKISVLLNNEDPHRINSESKAMVSPRAGPPGSGSGPASRNLTLGSIHPPNVSSMNSPSSWSLSGQPAPGQQGYNAPLQSPGIGSAGSGSTSYIGAGGSKTSSGNTSRGEGATGSRTQFHAPLEPEVVARLDELFFKFLQRICSDLNVCDSKGDPIHQPLMAKKMQRLEASTDFRPFKFRIQAFTNAFHESLVREGLTEDILPLRKVKVYLWKHRYISRFNEDGKKQKSKGNHVWNIEARKRPDPSSALSASSTTGSVTATSGSTTTGLSGAGSPEIKTVDGAEVMSTPQGKWEFREYSSRIAGQIIKFARVGVPYIYAPRIWDAQMSCPTADFTSPWLPGWLKWHKGELRGIPGPDDKSCTITVIAEYVREGEKCRLEMDFPLTVSDPQKEGDLMNEDTQEQDQEEEEDEDEEQGGQEGGSSQGEDDAEEEGVEDDEDVDDDEDEFDGEKEGKQAQAKASPERRSKRRRQT